MANNSRLSLAMTAARYLTEARDFIKDSAHWVQNVLYTGGSDPVNSFADVERVCAIGGVLKAANLGRDAHDNIAPDTHPEAFEALQVLADTIQGSQEECRRKKECRRKRSFRWWARDIHEFNDSHKTSHAEVISAFDLAIESQCAVVRDLAAQTEMSLDGKKDHAL